MVRAIVVFALVICKVVLPWVPFLVNTFLVQFYPRPRRITFPLIANVAF